MAAVVLLLSNHSISLGMVSASPCLNNLSTDIFLGVLSKCNEKDWCHLSRVSQKLYAWFYQNVSTKNQSLAVVGHPLFRADPSIIQSLAFNAAFNAKPDELIALLKHMNQDLYRYSYPRITSNRIDLSKPTKGLDYFDLSDIILLFII